MPVVLDAYALIALLADEPAAGEVGRLLAAGGVIVPAPNLAEAADRLGRGRSIAIERTCAAVGTLQESVDLRVGSLDERHAWRAAELRVAHYHRMRCPLSLADCLLLAVVGDGDELATADPHLLGVTAREGLGFIALPDSSGRRFKAPS